MPYLLVILIILPYQLFATFLSTDLAHIGATPFAYALNAPPNFIDQNGKWPLGYYRKKIIARHPKPLRSFELDVDSRATLNAMKPGQAIVGVVNKRTGKLYLNPVDRRPNPENFWSGEKWTGFQAKLRGVKVEPITHMEDHVQAHRQLARRVEEIKGNGVVNVEKYYGFGIRWNNNSEFCNHISFTPRSRSLNSADFVDFDSPNNNVIGNIDQARANWRKIQSRPYLAEDGTEKYPEITREPTIDELLQKSKHGWMNYRWSRGIEKELNKHFKAGKKIEETYW